MFQGCIEENNSIMSPKIKRYFKRMNHLFG